MRHSRKKITIYNTSPGLENTEKYGIKKYSPKKNKELEKLYNEFIILHNQRKLKKYGILYIKGKKRIWTVKKNPITNK